MKKRIRLFGSLLLALLICAGVWHFAAKRNDVQQTITRLIQHKAVRPVPRDFYDKLAYAAEDIVDPSIVYDPAYTQIPYPGGDVSPDRGVCSDVVIRAYRKLGIDLQKLVHEDMKAHFSAYPKKWGLRGTDTNIDHRRVPNLAVFFARHGEALPVTSYDEYYHAGDIVTWSVYNRPHIGLVSSLRNADNTRPLIVHNIGSGQMLEDMIFDYPITGHYRYAPKRR